MMKGVKEANKLKGQLEQLKKLQEIQRMKVELERKKREGIPIDATEQVTINFIFTTSTTLAFKPSKFMGKLYALLWAFVIIPAIYSSNKYITHL